MRLPQPLPLWSAPPEDADPPVATPAHTRGCFIRPGKWCPSFPLTFHHCAHFQGKLTNRCPIAGPPHAQPVLRKGPGASLHHTPRAVGPGSVDPTEPTRGGGRPAQVLVPVHAAALLGRTCLRSLLLRVSVTQAQLAGSSGLAHRFAFLFTLGPQRSLPSFFSTLAIYALLLLQILHYLIAVWPSGPATPSLEGQKRGIEGGPAPSFPWRSP